MAESNDKPVIIDHVHVRGDTFMKKVALYTITEDESGQKQKTPYEFQEGESLKFGISKSYKHLKDYDLIISQTIPTDTGVIDVPASDMEELDYGTYYYDVEFNRESDSFRKTLIQGKITITEESI